MKKEFNLSKLFYAFAIAFSVVTLSSCDNDDNSPLPVSYTHLDVYKRQLDDRLQPTAHFRVGDLGHINRHRQPERQSNQYGKQAHPKRTGNQRQEAEQGCRCCRGKPFRCGKHIFHGNGIILYKMHRIRLSYKLLRNESYDSGLSLIHIYCLATDTTKRRLARVSFSNATRSPLRMR